MAHQQVLLDRQGHARRRRLNLAKDILRWVLALGFVVAGSAHFLNPAFYVRIVPPQLGNALVLVYISGFCEIAGGIGVAVPRWRRPAAIGLIALLLAVFPANIHMALHPEQFADIGSPLALAVRLPIQFVFIAWVGWCCLRADRGQMIQHTLAEKVSNHCSDSS